MKTQFTPEPKKKTTVEAFKKLTPDSSSTASYEYDPSTKIFSITFKNGSTYDYPEVPAEVAELCKDTKSAGGMARNELKGFIGVKRS